MQTKGLRDYLGRHWVRILISLAILCFFLVHVLKWHEWELISRFENIAYDLRLTLTMPETIDDRIVIVEIVTGSIWWRSTSSLRNLRK